MLFNYLTCYRFGLIFLIDFIILFIMLQCSQTCGEGEMTREVVCLDKDRISQDCHYQDRPEAARECQEQLCGDTDTDIENMIDEEETEVENEIEEEYNEENIMRNGLAEGSGYGNEIPPSLFSYNFKCLQLHPT